MIREAKVVAIKKSEIKKGIYYVTVNDGFGEIRVIGTRNYKIGETVKIKARNPIDFIWDIVKEGK